MGQRVELMDEVEYISRHESGGIRKLTFINSQQVWKLHINHISYVDMMFTLQESVNKHKPVLALVDYDSLNLLQVSPA